MTSSPAPSNGASSSNAPASDRVWLVAHDFSRCADAAADLAVDDLVDSRAGGHIVLLHAYLVLVPGATIEVGALGPGVVHLEQAAMMEATRSLERVAERLRKRMNDARVQIEVVARIGAPAETILDEATRRNASRIVIGTHGRSGVTHLLLGSVAERVVRLAHVPVIVVHDTEAKAAR
jgi:nucleotide-binding universal stress UspA family protein